MLSVVYPSVHLGHAEVVVDQKENLSTCYHSVFLHSVNFIGLKGSLEFGRCNMRQRRRQLGIEGGHVVTGFCEHFVVNAWGTDLKDPLEWTLWSRRSCNNFVDQVHAPLPVVGRLRPSRNPDSLSLFELGSRGTCSFASRLAG